MVSSNDCLEEIFETVVPIRLSFQLPLTFTAQLAANRRLVKGRFSNSNIPLTLRVTRKLQESSLCSIPHWLTHFTHAFTYGFVLYLAFPIIFFSNEWNIIFSSQIMKETCTPVALNLDSNNYFMSFWCNSVILLLIPTMLLSFKTTHNSPDSLHFCSIQPPPSAISL